MTRGLFVLTVALLLSACGRREIPEQSVRFVCPGYEVAASAVGSRLGVIYVTSNGEQYTPAATCSRFIKGEQQ